MKTCSYQIRFLTPAFLGNASQQAQWRTPPIKALLRQWWRVAVAQQVRYNPDALREREAELFGVAADGGDSHQSLIRLHLSHWNEGNLKEWSRHEAVSHPEVRNPVGSDLYLGFGPLTYNTATRSTGLKSKAAIQANDSAILSLAVPDQHADAIRTALTLMNFYGTLGGRSRNGWGSFSLLPENGWPALDEALDSRFMRPWQEALQLDWPHALGRDNQRPLRLTTGQSSCGSWRKSRSGCARKKPLSFRKCARMGRFTTVIGSAIQLPPTRSGIGTRATCVFPTACASRCAPRRATPSSSSA